MADDPQRVADPERHLSLHVGASRPTCQRPLLRPPRCLERHYPQLKRVHLRDSPNSRLARPLVRLEARLATTVVAVSEGLAALCGRRPKARVVRIPDGIPIPPPTSRPPFRDPLRLGVVGAIDRGKGQDLAVIALAELLAVGIEAELHLVGREQDAAYAAELRSAAVGCVATLR